MYSICETCNRKLPLDKKLLCYLLSFDENYLYDFLTKYFNSEVTKSHVKGERTLALKHLNPMQFFYSIISHVAFKLYPYIDKRSKKFKELTKEQKIVEKNKKQMNREYQQKHINNIENFINSFMEYSDSLHFREICIHKPKNI